MIPKIIHYCWFGRGEMPELAKKCIKSWKQYCPDYEIREWNEDNFDLDYCPYVREAYDNKSYAFVTDVVRLYALYNEGGIYMDTDVELIKSIDTLLKYDGLMGYETSDRISTALIACRKQLPIIKSFLDDYKDNHFVLDDGTFDIQTNVTRITEKCRQFGMQPNGEYQEIDGLIILPVDFLCPKDYKTKEIHITKNTLCIHHFGESWHTPEMEWERKIRKRFSSIPGIYYFVLIVGSLKFHGLNFTINLIKVRCRRKFGMFKSLL